MTLFDNDQETDRGEINFDEDSKIRIFETQQRASKSAHDHLKKFLPFAVVAVVGIAVASYLMQPGVGSVIRPSNQMYDAVYDYLLTKEKRTPRELIFYKCDGFYWVKAYAEPRSYPPSNPYDDVNKYRISASENAVGTFLITTLPGGGADVPCSK
ncbi:MAG: hypothetical protein ACK4S4_08175 [Pyrinomonadaceae bacterium]